VKGIDMVDIMEMPDGVSLWAEEWAAMWPVVIKQVEGAGFTVAFADCKGLAHKSLEITIRHEALAAADAAIMASRLEDNGWTNVRLEPI
jgi:hypothetical protein